MRAWGVVNRPLRQLFDWRAWRRDRRGASAVYFALMTPLLLGTGVLAVDVGRLVVLRSQMQNAADAAAISAANQLDGEDGARDRASAVAKSALKNQTRLADDSQDLAVATVTFYSQLGASPKVATDDVEAIYVRVQLSPRTANTFLDSMLNMASTKKTKSEVSLDARATATPAHIICEAPPFMICDPGENNAALSLKNPANIGRQLVIKESGGGSFAPGNYGLLCPASGNCGASNIGDALAAEPAPGCYGETDGTLVDTATGVKTNQVRDGVNTRFDEGKANPKIPAQNIMPYDRDSDMATANILGNGNWNPTGYWNTYHPSEMAPSGLSTYTRYQMNLYEQGVTFARKGKQTLYPLPASLPAGYTKVTPPMQSIPPAGIPKSTPSNDPKRRVVKVAVLKCDALNVKGSHTYPTFGNFVEMFLTEPVGAAPASDIYAELIGPVSIFNLDHYHANIRLVD